MRNNRLPNCCTWPVIFLAAAVLSAAGQTAPDAGITLKGSVVETARHVITIGPTGLPAQIEIKAAPAELPLKGSRRVNASAAQLLARGRGPQLRAPIRLTAEVDGKEIEAVPQEAVQPALDKDMVRCSSKLTAGSVKATLETRYERDGALLAKLTYETSAAIDALQLVIDLNGTVDQVVPGPPVADKVQVYPPTHFALSSEEGLVWGNSGADAKQTAGRAVPGIVTHAYVGSGDRGFSWLTDADGWDIDAKKPTMTLARDEAGQVSWRIRLVNHRTKVKGAKTISFALLTHPATFKPKDHRRRGWLDWPFAGKQAGKPPLTLAGRAALAGKSGLLRADAAATFEAAGGAILSGPAGGDAISGTQHHVATYPIGLVRYLAGTHTGLGVRLQSNAHKLIKAGSNRAADRVLLGRALLHDIGLDAGSLAHLGDAARVAAALKGFGYFEADGATEFIPYWRSNRLLRFGEPFSQDGAFHLDQVNPVGQVYVSIFRRPYGRKGTKAMLVMVNESDHPVRDQLYVLNPGGLFGGPNRLTRNSAVEKYDFAAMPDNSDWGKPGLLSRGGDRGRAIALEDLEEGGTVLRASARRGSENYGPQIFIPAHDFRIFYGHGD